MRLTKQEQETIILFNEGDNFAEIYTHNVKLKNRLERYSVKHPEIALLERQDEYDAVTYRLPKKRLTVMLTEPFSEERRKAYQERGRNLRERTSCTGSFPDRSV